MLKVELMKTRWPLLVPVLLVGPVLTMFMGTPAKDDWASGYVMSVMQYAWLFYPLLAGVLAALVCRTEHVSGGWKSTLSLPVSRSSVFLAKFLLVAALLAVSQAVFLGTYLASGTLRELPGAIPWGDIARSLTLGWAAVLPIAALQLWASTRWKAFGSALALNVVLTLPAIFAAQSAEFGPWYPWAQPFRAMLSGIGPAADAVDFTALALTVAVGFAVALVGGLLSFRRADVPG